MTWLNVEPPREPFETTGNADGCVEVLDGGVGLLALVHEKNPPQISSPHA